MINLRDYRGKDVLITFTDGDTLSGFVAYYTSDLDDPDGKENMTIEKNNGNRLIDVYADEIADIKVIAHEN